MRLAERRHRSCDIHCAAACWSRMLTRSDGQTAGPLQSISLTSCWGGLCVHPGGGARGGGGRRWKRQTEREGERGRENQVSGEWNFRPYPFSPSPYEYVNPTGQVGINDSPPPGIQGSESSREEGEEGGKRFLLMFSSSSGGSSG